MAGQPLNPGSQDFNTFGEMLRYLRERAHLTQRELGARVGYHYSYISYLEKNLRLPDPASLLGRFIPALGLEEEPELTARLLALATEQQKKSPIPTHTKTAVVEEAKTHRLPVSLTSMLGREREVTSLHEMLQRAGTRLITIVGSPGVGKTRLALYIAEHALPLFRDGVIFVDLTAVRQAALVLPTIGSALDVQEATPGNLKDTLCDKQALILLDNFEQVVDAASKLVRLLADAPAIKILVTSREALRVRGEHEFQLSPLPVPNDSFLDSAAVQLFFERARAVKPDFKADSETARRAAEICRRLDGLPLAIELAAARVGTMSLSAMIEQLDRRFAWLTRGARDLPEWRRTLWGAIDWSYALLSEPERALFERLSIFSGGWTFESARTVGKDETLCTPTAIFSLLMQLADKSLVTVDVEQGRYNYLETLREFAFEKLQASGDLARIQQAHCEYFLGFMQTARPHISEGADQAHWLNQVERDYSNIQNALTWAIKTTGHAETAMQFGKAVHVFWLTRSRLSEARDWLDQILALDSAPSPIRADLLRYASDYASAQGDFKSAENFELEGLDISKALGDEEGIHYSMAGIAMMAGMQGNYARAADLLEQVLAYQRRGDNTGRLTATLNNLAIATRRLGNLARARELYTEAISITETTANYGSLAHALLGLAEVHMDQGQYEQAALLQRRSISIRHELGFLKGLTFSLKSLAVSMLHLGQTNLAVRLESAAEKIRQELGVSISSDTRAGSGEFLAALQASLPQDQFEAAWQQGQSMSVEAVVALATSE